TWSPPSFPSQRLQIGGGIAAHFRELCGDDHALRAPTPANCASRPTQHLVTRHPMIQSCRALMATMAPDMDDIAGRRFWHSMTGTQRERLSLGGSITSTLRNIWLDQFRAVARNP